MNQELKEKLIRLMDSYMELHNIADGSGFYPTNDNSDEYDLLFADKDYLVESLLAFGGCLKEVINNYLDISQILVFYNCLSDKAQKRELE